MVRAFIIDGVNVSECEFFRYELDCSCKLGKNKDLGMKPFCGQNKNCHFKRYVRAVILRQHTINELAVAHQQYNSVVQQNSKLQEALKIIGIRINELQKDISIITFQ